MNKSPVEVREAKERLDVLDLAEYRPLLNDAHLLSIHLQPFGAY